MNKLEVLYQDNYLLAVNKPSGLMVEPDRYGHPSVVEAVRSLMGQRLRLKKGPGVIYRLDRWVSGVLILAQTPMALRELNRQVEERRVMKRYVALVEGVFEQDDGRWVHHLKRSSDKKRAEPALEDETGAQEAVTKWRVIARGPNWTKIEIELKTGRFHQIRVQASAEGHPIVNDVTYGAKQAYAGQNIALHAHCYGFHHPKSGEWMELSVEPEFDMPAEMP